MGWLFLLQVLTLLVFAVGRIANQPYLPIIAIFGFIGFILWFAPLERRRLRSEIREKILRATSRDPALLPFVGISFGNPDASYSGDSSWDVGFLSSDNRGIIYLGDYAAWHLPWSQILKIEPVWVMTRRQLDFSWSVSWRSPEGEEATICLRSFENPIQFWRDRHCERIHRILNGARAPLVDTVPAALTPRLDAEGYPSRSSYLLLSKLTNE